jgi:hypothetical protein
MFEEQSRVEEDRDAAAARGQYAIPDVRERLLWMAAGFERLADQVENWENTRLATAANLIKRSARVWTWSGNPPLPAVPAPAAASSARALWTVRAC